jgi:hypothetical protein
VATQEGIEFGAKIFGIGSGWHQLKHRLKWFRHVQKRSLEASARRGVLEWVDNVKRGRVDLK